MHIVTEFITSILSVYLIFSNGLSDTLLHFFAEPASPPIPPPATLTPLPSHHRIIPDILRTSSQYQQAVTIGAATKVGTSTDPKEALVNVFCTYTTDDYIRTTTGSGFFIDPHGVILTNAHVAQFLLFEQTDTQAITDCTIRTGNPAAATYHAKLLYISPTWIQTNAKLIQANAPTGTGERDYALLYVTDHIGDEPLPDTFPALPLHVQDLSIDTKNGLVLAAGYPALHLLEDNAFAFLTPQTATTSVSELYTFGSNRADVFSLRGSTVGVEGVSGGPVIDTNGMVIGMITTRGDDVTDGSGSLRAITIPYINRTILEETNFNLFQTSQGDLPHRATIFAETLSPFLLTLLQMNQ